MDCNLSGSSDHGIFQARILEWVAISFSKGSSWPKDQSRVSCIAGRRFTIWATREGKKLNYMWICKFIGNSLKFPFGFRESRIPLNARKYFEWDADKKITSKVMSQMNKSKSNKKIETLKKNWLIYQVQKRKCWLSLYIYKI